jgi:hypothetical protein
LRCAACCVRQGRRVVGWDKHGAEMLYVGERLCGQKQLFGVMYPAVDMIIRQLPRILKLYAPARLGVLQHTLHNTLLSTLLHTHTHTHTHMKRCTHARMHACTH